MHHHSWISCSLGKRRDDSLDQGCPSKDMVSPVVEEKGPLRWGAGKYSEIGVPSCTGSRGFPDLNWISGILIRWCLVWIICLYCPSVLMWSHLPFSSMFSSVVCIQFLLLSILITVNFVAFLCWSLSCFVLWDYGINYLTFSYMPRSHNTELQKLLKNVLLLEHHILTPLIQGWSPWFGISELLKDPWSLEGK